MNREPVAVRTALVAAVAAILHVLVILGVLDLDAAAETALVGAVDLVAALAIILLVRPKVTPVADPKLTEGQIDNLTVVNSNGNDLPDVVVSTDRVPGPDHRA